MAVEAGPPRIDQSIFCARVLVPLRPDLVTGRRFDSLVHAGCAAGESACFESGPWLRNEFFLSIQLLYPRRVPAFALIASNRFEL